MKFNFKHFMVQTAIVSSVLFSPLLQSCGKGEGPLPDPEPPVVVDPPGNGEEPIAMDTIRVEPVHEGIIIGFSDVHYPDPTNIYDSEYGASQIVTGILNFAQAKEGEKVIAKAHVVINMDLPTKHPTNTSLSNTTSTFTITPVDSDVLFVGSHYTSIADAGKETKATNPNVAIKELVMKEDTNDGLCLEKDSLDAHWLDGLSDAKFNGFLTDELTELFSANKNHITIYNANNVARVVSDFNDIDYERDKHVVIEGDIFLSKIVPSWVATQGQCYKLSDGTLLRPKYDL